MSSLVIILVFAILCVSCWNSVAGKESVVKITADNMDVFMARQPLLLEFYAPWCKHCQVFEAQYNSIAETITRDGVAVGKIDVDESQAIASRFDVDSIPCFFFNRDNKIWKYTGPNTMEGIIKFVREEYKTTDPLPIWASPLGPIGMSKGFLISLGAKLMNLLPFLSTTLGVPEWVGFVIVAFGFGTFIMLVTLLGVYLSVKHAKLD